MDNLRGLLGIRRMDRVPNAQISELCGAMKGVDERTDEGRGSPVVRPNVEKEKIAKRVYVGECTGGR